MLHRVACLLPGNLLLDELHRMLIREAGNIEPIANNPNYCSRVFMYQIGNIEGIFLGVALCWLDPRTNTAWCVRRLPDVN
jgi:hypothetical protein